MKSKYNFIEDCTLGCEIGKQGGMMKKELYDYAEQTLNFTNQKTLNWIKYHRNRYRLVKVDEKFLLTGKFYHEIKVQLDAMFGLYRELLNKLADSTIYKVEAKL